MVSELWYGGCNINVQCSCYTEYGRYDLSCLYSETVECGSSAGCVWYVNWSLCYVVKFITDEHGRYGSMEDCGVSNAA